LNEIKLNEAKKNSNSRETKDMNFKQTKAKFLGSRESYHALKFKHHQGTWRGSTRMFLTWKTSQA
jgi:hypothetical protein